MVYYIHSFGRHDSSSASLSSAPSSRSSRASNMSNMSNTSNMSIDSDMSGYDFGKKRSKRGNDKFSARLMCSAKLGFWAGMVMMLLGYLSFTMFDVELFRKVDPINKGKLLDWQKLTIYAGVVFLVVTFGAYAMSYQKSD